MRTITMELITVGEWIDQLNLETKHLTVTWTNLPKRNHTWGESFETQDEFSLDTELSYWDDDGHQAEIYGREDVMLSYDFDGRCDEVEIYPYDAVKHNPNNNFYELHDDAYILMEDYEFMQQHELWDWFMDENSLTDN